jgi:hypothetical protein
MILRDLIMLEDGNPSWNADQTIINIDKLDMIGNFL